MCCFLWDTISYLSAIFDIILDVLGTLPSKSSFFLLHLRLWRNQSVSVFVGEIVIFPPKSCVCRRKMILFNYQPLNSSYHCEACVIRHLFHSSVLVSIKNWTWSEASCRSPTGIFLGEKDGEEKIGSDDDRSPLCNQLEYLYD